MLLMILLTHFVLAVPADHQRLFLCFDKLGHFTFCRMPSNLNLFGLPFDDEDEFTNIVIHHNEFLDWMAQNHNQIQALRRYRNDRSFVGRVTRLARGLPFAGGAIALILKKAFQAHPNNRDETTEQPTIS